MLKHHPDNERIKHKYFSFLREALRVSDPTIDGVAKAIARFEHYTKYKDFRTFRYEQAIGFKKHMYEQKNQRKDTKLSKATLHSTFAHLKRFFEWLAREQGYKSRIQYTDAEYFNTSSKDMQVATAKRDKKVATLEQIKHVIQQMPSSTEIEMRDRALIAFTILTGARDSAIASAKIKHVNLDEGYFYQDAREVNTKFSKTFTTFFFPVGDEIKQTVRDWIEYLKKEKLWSHDDPVFPMTYIAIGANHQFEAAGLKPQHWSSATPIREIFKKAFISAGLPYFNPHSFRDTLTHLAQSACKTPEAFKAWSQNLGHEGVMTTFTSYGQVAQQRQREILEELASPTRDIQKNENELVYTIVKGLRELGVML